MKLKNFRNIKEIDEARAKEIINWYDKTRYSIGIDAGLGIGIGSIDLIQLLTIFANSKDIEKDVSQFVDYCFERSDVDDCQLGEEGQKRRKMNYCLEKMSKAEEVREKKFEEIKKHNLEEIKKKKEKRKRNNKGANDDKVINK